MSYTFSKSSLRRLQMVDKRLANVMFKAKELSEIDFDISCGYRSIKEQQHLYLEGKSQLDGINHKSKHNHSPAKAVDIYAYKDKYADYSHKKMKYLSDVIKRAAKELDVRITWGGDWEDFVDMPHYEVG